MLVGLECSELCARRLLYRRHADGCLKYPTLREVLRESLLQLSRDPATTKRSPAERNGGCLMIVNGLAILNNERFLEKCGWGFSQMHSGAGGGQSPGAVKQQIIGLIHAVAYLRVPLIVVNSMVILVKIVFG